MKYGLSVLPEHVVHIVNLRYGLSYLYMLSILLTTPVCASSQHIVCSLRKQRTLLYVDNWET